MNELTDIVAVDFVPFTCLPRTAQRVISFSQPEALLEDAIARCVGTTELTGSYRLIEGQVFTAVRLAA